VSVTDFVDRGTANHGLDCRDRKEARGGDGRGESDGSNARGPILRGRSRGKEAKGDSVLCERHWSNQLTAEVHVNVG
jgi:hypothetical protein